VKLSHDGLDLWYGTPDAPAPLDAVVPRSQASLVVGVHPANPTNGVVVHYRVDGGIVQDVPGRELRTDFDRQTQYFGVTFPTFYTGDLVEYSPVFSCSGRQVPATQVASRFQSKFRLAPKDSRPPQVAPATAQPSLRFVPGLDFVASVAVQFDPPQFIGETPAGMRVNFVVREGTFEGDGFCGRVLQASSDNMIVRPDGMGVVRIRAGFVLEGGAMLDVESGGYVDFGRDGYRRAVAHDLPDRSPLVVSPLIATRHPTYSWLSRIQCVGAGHTHLDAGQAHYHVYAATPRNIPATA
jgi:hypothetical protein